MRERIESRDRLSRHIVHAEPGDIHPELFNNFAQSSQVLLRVLLDKLKAKKLDDPRAILLERFSGPAAQEMVASLKECRIDPYAYVNAVDAISRLDRLNDLQSALLYLMLFIATGCTCDPLSAAQKVERFALDAPLERRPLGERRQLVGGDLARGPVGVDAVGGPAPLLEDQPLPVHDAPEVAPLVRHLAAPPDRDPPLGVLDAALRVEVHEPAHRRPPPL
jgi:hypothetical protein